MKPSRTKPYLHKVPQKFTVSVDLSAAGEDFGGVNVDHKGANRRISFLRQDATSKYRGLQMALSGRKDTTFAPRGNSSTSGFACAST
jgi:hypothetical protein